MAAESKTGKTRIPDFRSFEEEAEFWDTHDASEFEDELEPVEFTVANPLRHRWMLSVEIDEETFYALKEIAKARGTGATAMAKAWILEELARVRKSEGKAE